MNARTWLSIALVACSAGCAAELGGVSRSREQLDDYVISKPLAQAWPEALRFLNQRGYEPVGADRKLIGLGEMGSWATAASKGQETQVSGKRWTADTAMDTRGRRYRIIGVDLGPTTCRIGFFQVDVRGVVAPTEDRGREDMIRDTTIEMAFIQTFDPEGAAKMRPKDPGFF